MRDDRNTEDAMAAASVRIRADQLRWLNEQRRAQGVNVSRLVRDALDDVMDSGGTRQLSSIEWEGLSGGVVLTLRFTNGWAQSMAFDVDQAREIAGHLDAAIDAARESVS